MTTINPYLTFKGNCEEAFNFYKSVFGGEFSHVSRFKDMPANPDFPVPNSLNDKIMHISLPISKETVLMASDSADPSEQSGATESGFSISINSTSEAETERIFNELSAGGEVSMPLNKTFWGAYFGMFTDKFGVKWMVNCQLNEQEG